MSEKPPPPGEPGPDPPSNPYLPYEPPMPPGPESSPHNPFLLNYSDADLAQLGKPKGPFARAVDPLNRSQQKRDKQRPLAPLPVPADALQSRPKPDQGSQSGADFTRRAEVLTGLGGLGVVTLVGTWFQSPTALSSPWYWYFVALCGPLFVFSLLALFRVLPEPNSSNINWWRYGFCVPAGCYVAAAIVIAVLGAKPGTPGGGAAPQPNIASSITIYPAFQKAHDNNPKLGPPLTPPTNPQPWSYEGHYQKAYAIWVGRDQPQWIFIYTASGLWHAEPDDSKQWDQSISQVKQFFAQCGLPHLPQGFGYPYFGVAEMFREHGCSRMFQKVGWMELDGGQRPAECRFAHDVHVQAFRNGWIVGPVSTSGYIADPGRLYYILLGRRGGEYATQAANDNGTPACLVAERQP